VKAGRVHGRLKCLCGKHGEDYKKARRARSLGWLAQARANEAPRPVTPSLQQGPPRDPDEKYRQDTGQGHEA
jgi:hypothetical protein